MKLLEREAAVHNLRPRTAPPHITTHDTLRVCRQKMGPWPKEGGPLIATLPQTLQFSDDGICFMTDSKAGSQ
eukprot:2308280-Heterocapsa_arctica.AAC.1